MSVRRLADEAVQPTTFAFTKENQAWAEKKMAEYPPGRQQSAVIPVLFRAQEQQGWVSRAAIEAVGKLLDMPYIRVLEVATFYTQFLLQPVGTRAHIQVCGTTPCMLRGAKRSATSASAGSTTSRSRPTPRARSAGKRSSASAPASTLRW